MNTKLINTSIELPRKHPRSAFILFALACFALLPSMQAVVPAPDGGYPGGNTAEGQSALFSLTTGTYNTAVGFLSLRSNTAGESNTAIGAGALLANYNGGRNTATGVGALLSNSSGSANTAIGDRALLTHTTGDNNTAIGASALFSDTTGAHNTATGAAALFGNTTGSLNTAIGDTALALNTTGSENTANGYLALYFNTEGINNTANGAGALFNNTTGSNNTALGFSAGIGNSTADDVICIGNHVSGENVSNTCYIGNIFGVTSAGATGVVVNSAGKLGTIVSSRRFKDDIKPMDQASEALFALRPVSFHYKKEIDPEGVPQFGLVAEDVEKVNPDLVVRDAEGKVNTVRYEAVNAMLLNEFLKEHKTVQELKKEIKALREMVSNQDTKIHRIGNQMKLTKSTSRLVDNNQ